MLARLYIRSSLKKNPRSYISLLLILTVSMMMINIIGIYRDSFVRGDAIAREDRSRGFDLHIRGAVESELTYFSDIPGARTMYEDEVIYITIDGADDGQFDQLRRKVNQIIADEELDLEPVSYRKLRSTSSIPILFHITFTAVSAVFALLAAGAIGFVYNSFLNQRRPELGILRSLGARTSQLKRILWRELLAVWLAALLPAVLLSCLLMAGILNTFMNVRDEFLSTFAFGYSLTSFLILILLSAAALYLAFRAGMKRLLSDDVIDIIRQPLEMADFNRDIPVDGTASAVRYLSAANYKRHYKQRRICLFLTVPVLCVVLVIGNATILLNSNENLFGDVDFQVEIPYDALRERSDEITEKIEALEADNRITVSAFVMTSGPYMKLDPAKLDREPEYRYRDTEYVRITVRALTDAIWHEELTKLGLDTDAVGENAILLPASGYGGYQVGDRLSIAGGAPSGENETVFTVAGITDYDFGDGRFCILTNGTVYEELTGLPALPKLIGIRLRDPSDADSVRALLGEMFGGYPYTVNDIITHRANEAAYLRGETLIMALICAILFICVSLLLYNFLAAYIRSQKPQISVLRALGTRQKTISGIYAAETIRRAAVNVVLGMLAGTLATLAIFAAGRYSFPIHPYTLLLYTASGLIAVGAQLIPTVGTTRNLIAKEDLNVYSSYR